MRTRTRRNFHEAPRGESTISGICIFRSREKNNKKLDIAIFQAGTFRSKEIMIDDPVRHRRSYICTGFGVVFSRKFSLSEILRKVAGAKSGCRWDVLIKLGMPHALGELGRIAKDEFSRWSRCGARTRTRPVFYESPRGEKTYPHKRDPGARARS